jgi:hypothetical protein
MNMAPKKANKSSEKTKKISEPKEQKAPALAIDEEMLMLDYRMYSYYSSFTEEQRKAFGSLVLMRWATLVTTAEDKFYLRRPINNLCEDYITCVNEFVNIGYWSLTKHPELQWQLLATCGMGSQEAERRGIVRHGWIKGPGRTTTSKLDGLILRLMPNINNQELDLLKNKLTKDSVKKMCLDYGMEDSEIKGYLDAFKKYQDSGSKD